MPFLSHTYSSPLLKHQLPQGKGHVLFTIAHPVPGTVRKQVKYWLLVEQISANCIES